MIHVQHDEVILPLQYVWDILQQTIDGYSALLNLIAEEAEMQPGTDPMSKVVQRLRDEDGVHGWAQLYADPQNEFKAIWLGVLPPDRFNAMNAAVAAMSPEQQTAWLGRFFKEGHEAIASVMESDLEGLLDAWPDLVESPLGPQWIQARLHFVFATLFNVLAAMQTGKSMYQLVAEAMAGDDNSFVKAIQIDKTVLEHIPYFAERNRRAADEGDIAFLRRINEHRNKPLTITRIGYVRLWLAFDTLDRMNILDQFEQDMQGFAELCQSIRAYGPHADVEAVDLEDFKSRLKDYKRTRRHLIPRTRSSILVKDVSPSNSPP